MLGQKRTKEKIEAKIIERARNNLRHIDRWGRWWAAFHWLIAIGYAAIFIAVGNLAAGLRPVRPDREQMRAGGVSGR
jgi:hypothetical protein